MKIRSRNITWSCGVVVITSALHAEGPQFDPGRDHRFFWKIVSVERSVNTFILSRRKVLLTLALLHK